MKTFFAFFSLFFLFLNALFSEGFSISILPNCGITHGVLEEKIYNSSKNHEIISLLEWEKNLFLLGADAEISFKSFFVTAGFEIALPAECGEMRDSDWLNQKDRTMKTRYSFGENIAQNNVGFSLSFGRHFDFDTIFSIIPIFQTKYTFDSFERKNAEGFYSDDTKWYFDETSKHYPSEYYWSEEKQKYVRSVLAGVGYERYSIVFWVGSKVQFSISKKCTISFGAFFSAYSYTDATDTHHGSETKYRQTQSAVFSKIKIPFEIEFDLSKRLSLNFNAHALFGKTEKGELFVNGELNKAQPSGSTVQEILAKIGIKILAF